MREDSVTPATRRATVARVLSSGRAAPKFNQGEHARDSRLLD